jgi:hypothetical protein
MKNLKGFMQRLMAMRGKMRTWAWKRWLKRDFSDTVVLAKEK